MGSKRLGTSPSQQLQQQQHQSWSPRLHEEYEERKPATDDDNDNNNIVTTQSEALFRAYAAGTFVSVLVPLVALAVWAGYVAREPGVLDRFAGARIGGRLTQGQAKALDVACGAVLGPLLLAALNLVWFDAARVSAVNEKKRAGSSRGVPLASLAAMSSTSSGSFDVLSLYAIARGRTWRLALFAVLTVLAAVARVSVCNVVAYEAYPLDVLDPGVAVGTLRRLSDEVLARASGIPLDPIAAYEFTARQQAEITGRITGMLTELNFRAASSRLADDAYVGVNATTASMDRLPPPVVGLLDVPGYRLTARCEPARAEALAVVSMGLTTKVTARWYRDGGAEGEGLERDGKDDDDDGGGSDGLLMSADYPGVREIIQGADNGYYALAGFTPDKREAVLGYMTSFNYTERMIASTFGAVRPAVFNMTASGFRGTKSVMTVWGVRCGLYRQEGFLNYTRGTAAAADDDDEEGDGENSPHRQSQGQQQWTISASRFDAEKRRVPSVLGDWQLALNYNAPGAVIPGLGPPLAATAGVPCGGGQELGPKQPMTSASCTRPLDFRTYALNFLYASAAAEQMMYNVAATGAGSGNPPSSSSSSPSSSPSPPPRGRRPDYYFEVRGVERRDFYRMTYVPAILLAGLLSLAAAAAIAGALLLYASDTASARAFRRLDVLRLVHDGASGLRQQQQQQQDEVGPRAAPDRADNAALGEWAKRCFVSYYAYEEEERGRRVVCLSGT